MENKENFRVYTFNGLKDKDLLFKTIELLLKSKVWFKIDNNPLGDWTNLYVPLNVTLRFNQEREVWISYGY